MRQGTIPKPKYKLNSYFRHLDTEEVYKLVNVILDTYVLLSKNGNQVGESLLTLEYDYELLPEGAVFFHGD